MELVAKSPEEQASPEAPKPEVLYHASSRRDIQEFEPRQESIRDPLEGPVVFATPDKAYASCFLVPSDDSWVRISRFSENDSWKVIVGDKDRFIASDRGGSIYSLPVESFHNDPHKGTTGEQEWTSAQPVMPMSHEDYDSGIEAMREQGVEVFFVNRATFDRIKTAEDHGYGIISSLTPN